MVRVSVSVSVGVRVTKAKNRQDAGGKNKWMTCSNELEILNTLNVSGKFYLQKSPNT